VLQTETRWLGGSFFMVYRNNAGRLGSGLHQCVLRNSLAGSKQRFLCAGTTLYIKLWNWSRCVAWVRMQRRDAKPESRCDLELELVSLEMKPSGLNSNSPTFSLTRLLSRPGDNAQGWVMENTIAVHRGKCIAKQKETSWAPEQCLVWQSLSPSYAMLPRCLSSLALHTYVCTYICTLFLNFNGNTGTSRAPTRGPPNLPHVTSANSYPVAPSERRCFEKVSTPRPTAATWRVRDSSRLSGPERCAAASAPCWACAAPVHTFDSSSSESTFNCIPVHINMCIRVHEYACT